MATPTNSTLWSGYNPQYIQQIPLGQLIQGNPAVFTPPGASFDPSTGWSGGTPGADYAAATGQLDKLYAGLLPGVVAGTDPGYLKWQAEQIVGSDPQKYFNENNLSNNYRYNPTTGMVDVYIDPAAAAESDGGLMEFLGVPLTFAALAAGAGALNGAFGGAGAGAGVAEEMAALGGGWPGMTPIAPGAGAASWGLNAVPDGFENIGGELWQTGAELPAGTPPGLTGGFQMPAAVPETPAQLSEWGLVETSPGNWSMPSIPGSSFSAADWISKIASDPATWGKVAATALGMYGSNQQANSLADLAKQYQEYGAPSRARYEASMTPGFDPSSMPGYTEAIDSSMNSMLRGLSTKGNPFGNPGALMEANKYVVGNTALPALNEYRRLNANTGFGSSMNAALGLQTQGIGADANSLNALGYGINALTSPQNSLTDLLRQGGWNLNNGSPV